MWTSASVVLAGRALAFPLLQLIVESTLLLALAHFAATALRRRSAAERNAVWLATFAGLAALPLLLPIPAFWKLSLNHWPATNHTVAHFRLVHVVSAVDSSFAVRTGCGVACEFFVYRDSTGGRRIFLSQLKLLVHK
jgi:multisubunit Na+/H+ antiporter MnhB subunit